MQRLLETVEGVPSRFVIRSSTASKGLVVDGWFILTRREVLLGASRRPQGLRIRLKALLSGLILCSPWSTPAVKI
jgi:hypothetical protein